MNPRAYHVGDCALEARSGMSTPHQDPRVGPTLNGRNSKRIKAQLLQLWRVSVPKTSKEPTLLAGAESSRRGVGS